MVKIYGGDPCIVTAFMLWAVDDCAEDWHPVKFDKEYHAGVLVKIMPNDIISTMHYNLSIQEPSVIDPIINLPKRHRGY